MHCQKLFDVWKIRSEAAWNTCPWTSVLKPTSDIKTVPKSLQPLWGIRLPTCYMCFCARVPTSWVRILKSRSEYHILIQIQVRVSIESESQSLKSSPSMSLALPSQRLCPGPWAPQGRVAAVVLMSGPSTSSLNLNTTIKTQFKSSSSQSGKALSPHERFWCCVMGPSWVFWCCIWVPRDTSMYELAIWVQV